MKRSNHNRHILSNPNERARQIDNRKANFISSFPIRTIKFFCGFLLFIPLTAIAFGAHCFSENIWPWDESI